MGMQAKGVIVTLHWHRLDFFYSCVSDGTRLTSELQVSADGKP